MAMLVCLFAQAEAAAPGAAAGAAAGPPMWFNLIPIIGFVFIFYFLMIVPMRKEKQRMQQLYSGLKKGDRILTNAGIIGVIHSIKDGDDEVTIRSDESRFRILKSTIARVLPATESSETKN